MIISAGLNIAGPEVEMALLAHPDVLECGVVGDPDPERTMSVHAYVVLGPGVVGDDAKVADLQAHVRWTIAPYKAPRAVSSWTSCPVPPRASCSASVSESRRPDSDSDARLHRPCINQGGASAAQPCRLGAALSASGRRAPAGRTSCRTD